jgi:hypothetical protein
MYGLTSVTAGFPVSLAGEAETTSENRDWSGEHVRMHLCNSMMIYRS